MRGEQRCDLLFRLDFWFDWVEGKEREKEGGRDEETGSECRSVCVRDRYNESDTE